MEESDEDGEDNAEFLERLMVQTGQEVPQRELEEHYAVLEELGSGTYGRVVLTEPRDGGSPVVLKLMLKEQTERRAFLREYCIALCLSSHAACLRALPIAFESATHFAFGQELAPAGDLCALLNPGEGLAEELVKRCASQLAEALDFMHSRALVHRDVKLDNVLLFDRECRRVKLGDFGLTRVQGSAVGAMSGTLPYAPPELCLLQGSDTLELDSSLDVWAFAVLLFCLCTGCFPWAVAASSDPQFEDFSAWQGGTAGRGMPASWRGFGSGALEMLRRLLTLDPDRRSPAIEVQKYLSLPWVMAPSTGELAPSSSQSPLTSSMGESPGGTGGWGAASGGGGVTMPPANALASCWRGQGSACLLGSTVLGLSSTPLSSLHLCFGTRGSWSLCLWPSTLCLGSPCPPLPGDPQQAIGRGSISCTTNPGAKQALSKGGPALPHLSGAGKSLERRGHTGSCEARRIAGFGTAETFPL
ncbi:putative serine/threonine-protein kinase SBK3 [Spheniscus humboldti]